MRLDFSFDPAFFAAIPTEGICGDGCNPGNWGFGDRPNEDCDERRYYRTGSGAGKYVFYPDGTGYFEGRRNSLLNGSEGIVIQPEEGYLVVEIAPNNLRFAIFPTKMGSSMPNVPLWDSVQIPV